MSRGIVPEFFAGQRIKYRIPYHMPGEVVVTPNQSGVAFPEGQFLHNVDKPFEIDRMIIRLTAFDDAQTPALMEQQPNGLDERIRMSLLDISKDLRLTKNPGLISSFLTDDKRTWEWAVPYTIVRQEGLQVVLDADAFPTICVPNPADCDGPPVASVVGSVRVEVSFQGYLIILEPPA